MTADEQGNLADKPLGELIREIHERSSSGALRLSRDPAKTVMYFEDGATVFAISNIRAHRLIEFLKRSGGLAGEEALANLPPNANDDEVLAQLIQLGSLTPDQVGKLRANHIADILRTTLLWTEGHWQFDPRVRVTAQNRVSLETQRLVLESSRLLPRPYIESRFTNRDEYIEPGQHNSQSLSLSPNEAFVLSRVIAPMSIKDLLALGGMPEEETLRATYALTSTGLLRRASAATPRVIEPPRQTRAADDNLQNFLARIDRASDYYETLNIDRTSTADDIKNSYHAIARSYHPDRFHQASAAMRARIESAFARIAHAYDVLHDASARAAYDERLKGTGVVKAQEKTSPVPIPRMSERQTGNEDRAEASFQKGMNALKENQLPHAVRLFAEAASLEPRRARYRAEYGRALINDPQTRRLAEIELRAAIALEPTNVSYRIALAELYKAVGLRRRAEGELQRALMTDPKSDAARNLLASLKH